MATEQTAILLYDRKTQAPIGLITFHPVGMMQFNILTSELHVFALKPVERFFKENGFAEPMYVKHAAKRNVQKELPAEILEEEATAHAEAINRANSPVHAGKHELSARVVKVPAEE